MASSRVRLPGHILGVDPGKTTGMCLIDCTGTTPTKVWSYEVLEQDFAKPVRSALDWAVQYRQPLSVVCERFTITAATAKNSQAPYSLEMIGVLKQCMRDVGWSHEELIMQSPADAKALVQNQVLKDLGLWHVGGEGHALDALRHATLSIVRGGYKPVGLLSK